MNALISVSDKTGIVQFARALHALGVRLISTGGDTPRSRARRGEGSMSKKQIEECVRASLEGYFRDLRGTEPDGLYEMLVKVVERPLLEVVMAKAEQNQSRAAEWLGLNRNTLRKKLVEHRLLKS